MTSVLLTGISEPVPVTLRLKALTSGPEPVTLRLKALTSEQMPGVPATSE